MAKGDVLSEHDAQYLRKDDKLIVRAIARAMNHAGYMRQWRYKRD